MSFISVALADSQLYINLTALLPLTLSVIIMTRNPQWAKFSGSAGMCCTVLYIMTIHEVELIVMSTPNT
jgi:hypothetical protein